MLVCLLSGGGLRGFLIHRNSRGLASSKMRKSSVVSRFLGKMLFLPLIRGVWLGSKALKLSVR